MRVLLFFLCVFAASCVSRKQLPSIDNSSIATYEVIYAKGREVNRDTINVPAGSYTVTHTGDVIHFNFQGRPKAYVADWYSLKKL